MKLGAMDFVEKPIHNNPKLLKLARRTDFAAVKSHASLT